MPEELKKFIETFSKIPSLGPRQTTRLAFYFADLPKKDFKNLVEIFQNLEEIDHCPRCFFVKKKNEKFCKICSDEKRNKKIIALVEKGTDILTIEKIKKFNGVYFILGKLAEKGIIDEELRERIKKLHQIIRNELNRKVEEIIIAISPTPIGDFTSNIIKNEFSKYAKKISRLGRGLPEGAEIEFADENTLLFSFEKREYD